MMFSLFILLITFFVEGLYGLVVNSGGNYCIKASFSTERCINNAISLTSLANKINDEDSYYIKSWLNFGTIIIILIFLQFFRRHQRLTDREIDRGLTSASDYTLIITKLPPGKYTEDNIRNLVLKLWEEDSLTQEKIEIKNVILALDIREYVIVLKKTEEMKLKAAKAKYFYEQNGKYPKKINIHSINSQLEELQIKKKKIEDELKKGYFENTCGVVFVMLSSQEGNFQLLKINKFRL